MTQHILSWEANIKMIKQNKKIKNLVSLVIGEKGMIYDIKANGAFLRRLMDLGFIRGAEIEKTSKSPLGDPCAYKILDAVIALRASDAAKIIISEEKIWG